MSTEWQTIADAAEHLDVSTKTIRRWITQNRIEAKRLGPRLIRVNVASLDSLGTPLNDLGDIPRAHLGPIVMKPGEALIHAIREAGSPSQRAE